MRNIFVVNCGSSSIKYQLIAMPSETVLAKGGLERVGTSEGLLNHTSYMNGDKKTISCKAEVSDHSVGLQVILEALVSGETAVIKSVDAIVGVGHRVVHGGEDATESAVIDEKLIAIIEKNAILAPLHNPANVLGIRGAMEAIPHAPHVAVFDTAFLSTLPEQAYRYAVPAEWYRKYNVRRYGFHGTSHRYVTLRAASILGKDPADVNIITAHMGNGCSMTAIAGGVAIDHSMGMTPLEGLMMGTRSGDVDPAIIPYMMRAAGLTADQVDKALNKESGLLGVSELCNDMRDLLAFAKEGDEKARLATEMFAYRVVKYIGAYAAVVPNLDAIVFTGGIGENSVEIRESICKQLAHFGVEYDNDRNMEFIKGNCGPITSDDSKLPVWIVPTNEEVMIARDTVRLVKPCEVVG